MVSSHLNKIFLALILLVVLISPVLAACDNVSVSATEPKDLNYTYSTSLPLAYVAVNSTDCWVEIRSEKHFSNVTLECLDTTWSTDVDYDGNYTALYWVSNTSRNDECNTSLSFIVDRTSEFEDNKPAIVGLLILALIAIGSFIVYITKYLNNNFKALTLSLSFLFVYMAVALMINVTREYIKVPSIISNLETMFTVMSYAAYLIGAIMIIFFIANVLKKAQFWKKQKEEL